eukprot:PhF_6_TR43085/c1_g1_i1/m.65790
MSKTFNTVPVNILHVRRSNPLQIFFQKISRAFPSFRNNVFMVGLDGHRPKQIPFSHLVHGTTITDNYKYLEDILNPEAPHYKDALHLKTTEANFNFLHDLDKDMQGGKHKLWSEADCRMVTTSREGGFDKGEERIGNWLYYTRVLEAGGNDIGFFRKRVGESDMLGEELINPHELKKKFGYEHCNIGLCRVSPDGSMLAFTISVEGGDRYICHVRSLHDDEIYHVLRSSNIVSIEFGSDNNFFYTECNELNRPYRVMMLDVNKGLLSNEVEIYRDNDETFFVDVRKTKDGKYLCITSDAKSHGNVLLMPSSYPRLTPEEAVLFKNGPLEIAGKDSWGWLEHHYGNFYMVTSKNAPNFKVVRASAQDVLREGIKYTGWKDFIEHQDNVQIQDVDIFKTHLVLYENTFEFERNLQLRVVPFQSNHVKRDPSKDVILHFPALISLTPGLNRNFEQTEMSFIYSSLASPSSECVYKFDYGDAHTPAVIRRTAPEAMYAEQRNEMLSPWDYMWAYTTYRDYVKGHDGADIPVTICHRRDLFVEEVTDYDPFPDTPRKALIYVYGSYGEVPSLHFQLMPYLWLARRRWVICFAHVRGGGEKLGWEEQGKGKTKINTTLDFVACCQHLIDMGYAEAENIVAAGNSAGCVPIAAAANMHGRNLFGFALLRSPFLDIINTMMNKDLPLSLAERDVWGDPLNSAEDLERLKEYDPYYNIRDDQDYPAMIISAAMDDDRVPVWNTLKYVSRLREVREKRGTDPVAWPLICRIFDQGGHYSFSNTLELCEEIRWLCYKYNMLAPGQKVDDLDVMQIIHNQTNAGLIDDDDAKRTYLRWEAWEDERKNYYERMMDTENRVAVPRQIPEKSQKTFYWQNKDQGDPFGGDSQNPAKTTLSDSATKK